MVYLVYFVLAFLVGVYIDWKKVVVSFALFLVIAGLMLQFGFDPIYDHNFYIERLPSELPFSTFLTDFDRNIPPVVYPIYMLSYALGLDQNLTSLLLNCLYLSLSVVFMQGVVGKSSGLLNSAVLLFFPPIWFLLISLNKDLLHLVGLSGVFFSLIHVCNLRCGGVLTYKKFVLAIFSLLSWFIVYQCRYYTLVYLACSGFLYFLCFKLISQRNGMLLKLGFVLVASICVALFSLEFLADIVLQKQHEYTGNGFLNYLAGGVDPSLLEVAVLSCLAIVLNIVAPFYLFLLGNISFEKLSAGALLAVGYSLSLYALFKLCAEKERKGVFEWLMCYSCLHLVVQPFGSPNIGSLQRLFAFEWLFMSVVFSTWFANQFSSYGKSSFLLNLK